MTPPAAAASTDHDPNDVLPSIPGVVLEQRIGAGGMGWVFRGRQSYLDRPVAVKVLRLKYGSAKGADSVERFRREAKLLAEMSETHIVSCFDAGVTTEGECYLTMEFIDGSDLQQYIDENGPLPEPIATGIVRDLAQALNHALDRGIIHRDVKAANVMMKPLPVKDDSPFSFEIKLTDLGLARYQEQDALEDNLSVPGQFYGTPLIMSPEQFDPSATVDFRTDIYALGCLYFFLLSGKQPFASKSLAEVMQKKSKAESVDYSLLPPTCDPALRQFLQRMMAVRRDNRPQSYEEIVAFCKSRLAGPDGKPKKVNRKVALIGVLVVLGLTVYPSYLIGKMRLDRIDATENVHVDGPVRVARPRSAPSTGGEVTVAPPTATTTTTPVVVAPVIAPSVPAPMPAPRVQFAAQEQSLLGTAYTTRFAAWQSTGSWGPEEDGEGVVGVSGRTWACSAYTLTAPGVHLRGRINPGTSFETLVGVRLEDGDLRVLRIQSQGPVLLASLATGSVDADGKPSLEPMIGAQAVVPPGADGFVAVDFVAGNGELQATLGGKLVQARLDGTPVALVLLVYRGDARFRDLAQYPATPLPGEQAAR